LAVQRYGGAFLITEDGGGGVGGVTLFGLPNVTATCWSCARTV
jgi:hypothetical protein